MCCARCGKKKGLQGVGSESEHSRAYALCKMALPFGPADPIVNNIM